MSKCLKFIVYSVFRVTLVSAAHTPTTVTKLQIQEHANIGKYYWYFLLHVFSFSSHYLCLSVYPSILSLLIASLKGIISLSFLSVMSKINDYLFFQQPPPRNPSSSSSRVTSSFSPTLPPHPSLLPPAPSSP